MAPNSFEGIMPVTDKLNRDLTVEPDRVSFLIPESGARFVGSYLPESDRLTGAWFEGGRQTSLTFRQMAALPPGVGP